MSATESSHDTVSVHGLTMDRTRHTATCDDTELILTPTEFRLLWTLAQNPGRTYSRLELIDRSRGEDANALERTIDVHVRALRQKLEDKSKLIETVRGVGYRFQT